jgi:hypothetical protein
MYRRQLESAVAATAFHSSTGYSWFGQPSAGLPPEVAAGLAPTAARDYLRFQLQYHLYAHFYCRGGAVPDDGESLSPTGIGRSAFVEALSQANSSTGYWENGWRLIEHQPAAVLASKDGLRLQARPDSYRTTTDRVLEPGAPLRLRFPKEFMGLSPGFYVASADEPLAADASIALIRFYWHLTPAAAFDFVRLLTELGNRRHLPFRLKVVNDPRRFTRCDAGVLYVARDRYDEVAEVVAGVYQRLRSGLRSPTPALTKALAPGLGFAEDPGGSESFGLHRCRLLADGLIRGYEEGRNGINERLEAVAERFHEDGIELDAPFLNRGSRDAYPFTIKDLTPALAIEPAREAAPGAPAVEITSYLAVAQRIGERLTGEAIWSGSRCSWLGARPRDLSSAAAMSPTLEALGPDLYGGTAGVGLFLGQLAALTGDSTTGRTALGAFRHSMSRASDLPASRWIGLYDGWLGLAMAGARLGLLLDEDEPFAQAAALAERVAGGVLESDEFDLLSGKAGAIVSLLALRRVLRDETLLDVAIRLGDELLADAKRSEDGWSWKSASFHTYRNLTGLSHGTSGAALALLELHNVTADHRYREAALQAMRYEQAAFDSQAGNWPDWRNPPSADGTPAFAIYWCHGAAGIALSRIRAYELLGTESIAAEARIALHTTRRVLDNNASLSNFSLCHGLAGNAEIAAHGIAPFGRDTGEGADLAHRVAARGIELYGAPAAAWPCGTGGGETPGLMLGIAGIGYFYLRMHDWQIPSVLLPTPDFPQSGRGAA